MLSNHFNPLLSHLRRSTSGGVWLREIDGLRFIAILPVVMQHFLERFARNTAAAVPHRLMDDPLAFFISRGTVGVFLFFAISGFVLALPFGKAAMAGEKSVSLRSFYWRRLTRIEPPYLIWMTVFAALLLLRGTFSATEILPHWVASMTYTHGLFYGLHSPINPVAWSLEVEIQFYLLAPFLANCYFGFKNVAHRRAGLLIFLAIWLTLQYFAGFWFFPFKLTLLGQLQHFLIGFLVADFFVNGWKNAPRQHFIWDLLAPMAFVAMCYSWTTEFWKNIVFATALLILMTAAFRGVVFPKLLRNHWVAVTGGMCYTIYLTHLPLLEGLMRFSSKMTVAGSFWANFWLQASVCLAVVWAISAVFFLLTEKPFMLWKPKSSNFACLVETFNGRFFSKIAKRTGFVLLVFFAANHLQAQTAETAPISMAPNDSLPRLRPLKTLIEAALENAHALKANKVDTKKQAIAVKIQRNSWADLVTVGGTVLQGNGYVLDANSDATGTRYLSTDRKNRGGNLSVNFRISGGDVLNRRQKTEIQRLQLDHLREERAEIVQSIRLETIAAYCNTELALKMVAHKADAVENLRLALTLAEKYFKEGSLPLVEYTTLLTKMTSAEEQLTQTQAEAEKLTLLLQEMVGDDIWQR